MANRDVTPAEVKSITEELECSPSLHSPGSKLYNPGAEPTASHHGPKHKSGAKGHMTNKESGFGSARRTASKNVPKHV